MPADAIDAIFAGAVPSAAPSESKKKSKKEKSKKEKAAAEAPVVVAAALKGALPPPPRPRAAQAADAFADPRGTQHTRYTDDGLRIYDARELGINPEGGDTPACPFDCTCCCECAPGCVERRES